LTDSRLYNPKPLLRPSHACSKSLLAAVMESRIAMGDSSALQDLDALTYQCIGFLMAGVDSSGSSLTNLLCALTQVCWWFRWL